MQEKKLTNLERLRDMLAQLRQYVASFAKTYVPAYVASLLKNGTTQNTQASRTTTTTANSSFAVELDKNGKLSVNIPGASTSLPGLMSAADKTKLGGIAAGAQTGTVKRVYAGDGVVVEDMTTIDGQAQATADGNYTGLGEDTSTKEAYLKLFGRIKLNLKSTTPDLEEIADVPTSGGRILPVKLDKKRVLATRVPEVSTARSGLMTSAMMTKLAGIDEGAKPGTVTSVATGKGLTGGPVTTSGTIGLNLKSSTNDADTVPAPLTAATSASTLVAVKLDSGNLLCVRIPYAASYATGLMTSGQYNNLAALLSWKDGLQLSDIAGYDDLYTQLTTEINQKTATLYRPKGSMAASQLTQSILEHSEEGDVYNITEAFTTSGGLFVDGDGKQYPAGTNVVVVGVDSGSGNTVTRSKKFDVLAGFVDLTPYQKSDDLGTATTQDIRDLFNTNGGATTGDAATLGTADATATLSGQTLPVLMPVSGTTGQTTL